MDTTRNRISNFAAVMPRVGFLAALLSSSSGVVQAQEAASGASAAGGSAQLRSVITPPVQMPGHAKDLLAQQGTSGGSGSATPTQFDLTPVKLPERGSAFANMQSFKTGLLYHLPSQMFFNASCENSLRCETNIFQNKDNHRADMIYRVLPNVTLGYALTKQTRVAANYFMFRDQYTEHSQLFSRNIHSIGFRGDHDFIISPRTTITTSFFARELFISRADELCDLIPSVSIVRRVGDRGAIYGGVLGQLRWRDVFERFQEGDQFYSMGGVYRLPMWTFLADTTLVTNFGDAGLRGGAAHNQVIIMTMEADRKVHPRLPLTAFVRAEPIFNMGSNATGFAGFNFRIFGGLRAEVTKPAIFPVRIKGG